MGNLASVGGTETQFLKCVCMQCPLVLMSELIQDVAVTVLLLCLVLCPRNVQINSSSDDVKMAECRRVWWETRDVTKALQLVCRHNCIEQSLLRGLAKMGPNNYAAALSMVRHGFVFNCSGNRYCY